MTNWELDLGPYDFRPLKLRKRGNPPMEGWDVYALQTGLWGLDYSLGSSGIDGIFGKHTKSAVKAFQSWHGGLVVDGIAGGATQRALGEEYSKEAATEFVLPDGIPYGHLEKESGFLVGNHTPPYSNGSRDIGVAQRNTKYLTTGNEYEEGFDVVGSVYELAWRTRAYYEKYKGWGVEEKRAWRLACGAWNAPAWTDTLAQGGTLSPVNYEWISGYIERVTAYADLD